MDAEARWPRKLGTAGAKWGEDSRMWSGTDVLTGLVEAIDTLLERTPRRHDPAVLGCSPWLTDTALVDALVKVHSCIVTTKPTKRPDAEMVRLHRDGSPIPKPWLRSLDTSGRRMPDGDRPTELAGASDNIDEGHDFDLGPIRVAGWRQPSSSRAFPIVHAKVAVLGHYRHDFVDNDYGGTEEIFGFDATAVWIGSANFTRQSRVSAEIGLLSTDWWLMHQTEWFLADVLRVSEPFSEITAAEPSPDLVDAYQWEPSAADLEDIQRRDGEYIADEGGEGWDDR